MLDYSKQMVYKRILLMCLRNNYFKTILNRDYVEAKYMAIVTKN